MREAEWITTRLPLHMLREYPAAWNGRKARLFWAACLRHIWHLVTDEQTRRLVELVEADPEGVPGAAAEAARQRLSVHPDYPYRTGKYHPDYWALGVFLDPPPDPLIALAGRMTDHLVDDAGRRADVAPQSAGWLRLRDLAEAREKVWQCGLIREVFGNPFRPVDFAPWRTSDAVALARGIYEEKAFDRMPILADALQDAGCDDVNVLDHCRDVPGGGVGEPAGGSPNRTEHVRGCWVLDGVLGQ